MLQQPTTSTSRYSKVSINENDILSTAEHESAISDEEEAGRPTVTPSSTRVNIIRDRVPVRRHFLCNPLLLCSIFLNLFLLLAVWHLMNSDLPSLPATVYTQYQQCSALSSSDFFTTICHSPLVASQGTPPSILFSLNPSVLSTPPRILISAVNTFGSAQPQRRDSNDLYHLTALETDYNLFTLKPDLASGGLEFSRFPLIRSTNQEYSQATSTSSYTGRLCLLDLVRLQSYIPSDYQNVSFYNLDSLILNLFFVLESPRSDDENNRLSSLEVSNVKVHSRDVRIDVKIHRGFGMRITSQAVSFSLILLPSIPHRARESAMDDIGYFTSSFPLVDSPPFLSRRWDPTLRLIQTRRSFVYNIDPSVPLQFREAVKAGVLAWNKAFEKIGLDSLLQVIEPTVEDAEYNAGDGFTTSISWSMSEDLTFAIAPSVVDPMTGEIISSSIVITTGWPEVWQFQDVVYPSSVSSRAQNKMCLKRYLQEISSDDLLPTIKAGVTDIVMHEVGHSLGLRHNFKGSLGIPYDKLSDDEYIKTNSLGSSVMDYIPRNRKSKIQFSPAIGAWDYIAIEYGYRPLGDPTLMEHRLVLNNGFMSQTIELNSDPVLKKIAMEAGPFATDEDSVHESGMDPYASDFDLSSEPVFYFEDQLDYVASSLLSFEKEGYNKVELYGSLSSIVLRSCLYIMKYIGGRFVVDKTKTVSIVNLQMQQRALETVLNVVINGTFRTRNLFPQHDYVKRTGTCRGVDQYCFGKGVESYLQLKWNVQEKIWNSLIACERMNRLGEQQQDKAKKLMGLRMMLDKIFDAVWGNKLDLKVHEDLFPMQKLWASSFGKLLLNEKNLSSIVAANLKMDANKLDELFTGEIVFASPLTKAHWVLVERELKNGGLLGASEGLKM